METTAAAAANLTIMQKVQDILAMTEELVALPEQPKSLSWDDIKYFLTLTAELARAGAIVNDENQRYRATLQYMAQFESPVGVMARQALSPNVKDEPCSKS